MLVFRRSIRAAFLFGIALIGFLLALSALTVGELDAFGVVLFAVVGAWSTLVLVQAFRVAVIATEQDVIVRNWLTTKQLPWADVAKVRKPPPYPAFRNAGLQIVTRSGKIVSAAAYVRGSLDGPNLAVDVVTKLEQLRNAATQNPDPPTNEHTRRA